MLTENKSYTKIFNPNDFLTMPKGRFKQKIGTYITLAKIIYNGVVYKIGAGGSGGSGDGSGGGQDGNVNVNGSYTTWIFATPEERWDLSLFANDTLLETLHTIKSDTDAAPIPEWDEFFAYLSDPEIEQLANMAIFSNTSTIKVAYREANLPIMQNVSTFSQFASWISDNIGEAGSMPTSAFINGDDLIIPIDIYKGLPKRFNFNTPTMRPNLDCDVLIKENGDAVATYGTASNRFQDPVLVISYEDEHGDIIRNVIYAYQDTVDNTGLIVPQGWSGWNGIDYTSFDINSNPVYVDAMDGMQFTHLMRVFGDVEFETATIDAYKIKNTIDLSAIPDGFQATGSSFNMYCDGTDNKMLTLYYGDDKIFRSFVYVESATEMEGVTLSPGWNEVFDTGSEFSALPYDMTINPIIAAAGDDLTTSDAEALLTIVESAGQITVTMEAYYGSVHFIFRT